MKIEITKAVVLLTNGADEILLHTDFPNGVWPFEGNQIIKTEIASNQGEDWVKENLKIIPSVINGRTKIL